MVGVGDVESDDAARRAEHQHPDCQGRSMARSVDTSRREGLSHAPLRVLPAQRMASATSRAVRAGCSASVVAPITRVPSMSR